MASSVELALQQWRDRLLDLSSGNPWLSLPPRQDDGLVVSQPSLGTVFGRLVQGRQAWRFGMPPSDSFPYQGGAQGGVPAKGQPSSEGDELVCGGLDRRRLRQIWTTLYRRSQNEFRQHGSRGLYLAFGVLEWRDTENQETYRSPLVLLSVMLRRNAVADPFLLEPAGEWPMVNPALALKLQEEFQFTLPAAPAAWDEVSLVAFLGGVQTAIAGLAGWRVDNTVLLRRFPPFKGDFYHDLRDHGEVVAAHPLVRALAGETHPALRDALAGSALPEEEELDAVQDPATCYWVVDADAGQRLCLEAAVRGHHLVIHGAAGTGKRQTIVNLIADCLARDKRVLCISPKRTALHVICQRLGQVGLGDFCLELHSDRARPAQVVEELLRCFRQQPLTPVESGEWSAESEARTATISPPRVGAGGTDAHGSAESEARTATISPSALHSPLSTGTTPPDPGVLKQKRDYLAGYVQALHAVREPLRRSAWSALTELAPLASLPLVPLGMPLLRQDAEDSDTILVVAELSPSWLEEARQALARLEQLGQIHGQRDLLWAGFKAERYNQQLREEVVGLIDKVQARLDRLVEVAKNYGNRIGASGFIPWLLKVAETLDALPGKVPAAWLPDPDLDRLAQDLAQCGEQYQRLGQARAPLTARYGPGLWHLPDGTAARVAGAWHTAVPLAAPGDDRGAGLLTHQQALRGWAADTQKRIPGWIAEARTLEKWLAVALPPGAGTAAASEGKGKGEGTDPSPATLRQLLRLANLCQSDNPPERSWAHNPQALEEARKLIAACKPAFVDYHARRRKLLETYTENLFELELDRMAAGFAGPYQNWLRVFNPSFRRDRRTIRRRTRALVYPATAAQDIDEARHLVVEKARLESEGPQRQPILGRYEKGLETDFEAAERATRVAAEAVELVRLLGCATLPARFLDVLCSPTPAPEKVRAAAKRLHDSLSAWLHTTHDLGDYLPMDSLPGTGRPLEECALSALNNYGRDLQISLNQFGSLTDPVLTKAPAPPPDAVTLVADLKEAEEVRNFEASQESEAARWSQRLGAAFQGLSTNWEALTKTLQWVRRLRELFKEQAIQEPLLPAPLVELIGGGGAMPSARDLRHAKEQYDHALHSLELRFEAPGLLLEGKRLGDHPQDVARQRLATLRDRVAEIADWIDWRKLPQRFAHLGLGAFWEAVQANRPAPYQLLPLFTKAFLTSWLAAVSKQDPALATFRRHDHEQVLAEFRALDRQWLGATARWIAKKVENQRPRSEPVAPGSEGALLLQHADKNSPADLATLFREVPNLLLQLKPCVLASPWQVSKLLAADKIPFDVVIVEEAGQIAVEDSLPAIYRGRQVIVLGDPPLAGVSDRDGDLIPGAVPLLAACAKAGLPVRSLTTDYRGADESLAAFANVHVYDQELRTFPAARPHDHPAVSLRHVADGLFDGKNLNNRREAQVVADLVLDHWRTHPEQSLGVTAFTTAQVEAIAEEIENRLEKNPELEKAVDANGSEGFFAQGPGGTAGEDREVMVFSLALGRDGDKRLPDFRLLTAVSPAPWMAAVTAARRHLLVVSALRPEDLNLKGAPPHVQALRLFLEYAAANGQGVTAGEVPETHSLLTDVLQELNRRGYEAVPLVGSSPNRVEIGVVDPEAPGNYLLGIEFDGPIYHALPTVTDRDRLRQEVLQELGWSIHRIWAPAWVNQRPEEVERLVRAVAEARGNRPLSQPSLLIGNSG